LENEDSKIKMGMTCVTMTNKKEGADALNMMEEHRVGVRGESSKSYEHG
jgi:hypothetical protein